MKNCRSSQGSPGAHFSASLFPQDSSGDLCDVSFASHYCPLKIFNGFLLPTGCPNSLETDKPSKLPGLPNQPCPQPHPHLLSSCVLLAATGSEFIQPHCVLAQALPFCQGSFLLLFLGVFLFISRTFFVVTPLHDVHLCIVTYPAAHLLVCL